MGITFSDINHTNVFLGQGLPRQQIITKVKINKWGLVKHKLLHSKGNHNQDEKTMYGLGENICK